MKPSNTPAITARTRLTISMISVCFPVRPWRAFCGEMLILGSVAGVLAGIGLLMVNGLLRPHHIRGRHVSTLASIPHHRAVKNVSRTFPLSPIRQRKRLGLSCLLVCTWPSPIRMCLITVSSTLVLASAMERECSSK